MPYHFRCPKWDSRMLSFPETYSMCDVFSFPCVFFVLIWNDQQAYNATAVIRQMRKLAMSGTNNMTSLDQPDSVESTSNSKQWSRELYYETKEIPTVMSLKTIVVHTKKMSAIIREQFDKKKTTTTTKSQEDASTHVFLYSISSLSLESMTPWLPGLLLDPDFMSGICEWKRRWKRRTRRTSRVQLEDEKTFSVRAKQITMSSCRTLYIKDNNSMKKERVTSSLRSTTCLQKALSRHTSWRSSSCSFMSPWVSLCKAFSTAIPSLVCVHGLWCTTYLSFLLYFYILCFIFSLH